MTERPHVCAPKSVAICPDFNHTVHASCSSMHLRASVAARPHGAIGPSVPTDENRMKIDLWVAISPDTRVVETTHAGERWTTQALEDGEIRYEEIEFGADEPELNQLAGWCERQAKKVEPRPPVKTSGVPLSDLPRRQKN
jgi:hypothetical protein